MPSVTSWTRLEPRARSDEMRVGLQARVCDPLWLLARQWQLGEFRGEDAGSPILARVQTERSKLSRYQPGPWRGTPGSAITIDRTRSLPLETLVERERVRPELDRVRGGARTDIRLAVEAGLHFFRMLGRTLAPTAVADYKAAYLSRYGIPPANDEERRSLDRESLRVLDLMAGRALDGARLCADLSPALRPAGGGPGTLPAQPPVPEADRGKVADAARAWLDWYDALFSEPAPGDASPWVPERMEYEFAVSAQTSQGEVWLAAPEYVEGHLDWHSFVVGATTPATLPAEPDVVAQAVIPAPVTYRGMPANRWWEFEDADVNLSGLDAGPADLAQLLLLEFALVYGNDHFVVPLEVPAGSLCRIRSLVVADTFGTRTLIRPAGQVDGPSAPWRMFSLSRHPRTGAAAAAPPPDLFLHPPGPRVSSRPPCKARRSRRCCSSATKWRTSPGPSSASSGTSPGGGSIGRRRIMTRSGGSREKPGHRPSRQLRSRIVWRPMFLISGSR